VLRLLGVDNFPCRSRGRFGFSSALVVGAHLRSL
jgi:hypothetical protein